MYCTGKSSSSSCDSRAFKHSDCAEEPGLRGYPFSMLLVHVTRENETLQLLASEASLSLVMSIELEIYYIYIFIYLYIYIYYIYIYLYIIQITHLYIFISNI